ncbi:hypothetical protein D3C78_1240900 [compost metagenome]
MPVHQLGQFLQHSAPQVRHAKQQRNVNAGGEQRGDYGAQDQLQASSFPGFGDDLAQLVGGGFGGLLYRVVLGLIEVLGRNDKGAPATQQHHVALHDRIDRDIEVVGVIQRLTDHRFRPFDPRGRGFTEEGRAKHHDAAVGHFQFNGSINRFRCVISPQLHRPEHPENSKHYSEQPAPHVSDPYVTKFKSRVRTAA